jgi:hypothetical protein
VYSQVPMAAEPLSVAKKKATQVALGRCIDRCSDQGLFLVFRLIVIVFRLVLCFRQIIAFHAFGLLLIGLHG